MISTFPLGATPVEKKPDFSFEGGPGSCLTLTQNTRESCSVVGEGILI